MPAWIKMISDKDASPELVNHWANARQAGTGNRALA
jgi:hypothetical protein